MHALVGDELLGTSWFAWRAGAALGFVDGHIRQLDDNLREVRFDNRAASLGPMGVLRLQTPSLHGASLGASGSLAVLLYTQRFPAGGDHYNFALRVGPFVEQRVSSVWIAVSYQLLHVSNGQGLGPHNPSYDAAGLGVWLSRAW